MVTPASGFVASAPDPGLGPDPLLILGQAVAGTSQLVSAYTPTWWFTWELSAPPFHVRIGEALMMPPMFYASVRLLSSDTFGGGGELRFKVPETDDPQVVADAVTAAIDDFVRGLAAHLERVKGVKP